MQENLVNGDYKKKKTVELKFLLESGCVASKRCTKELFVSVDPGISSTDGV